MALDRVEHVTGVEAVDDVLDDDGAARDPAGQGVPVRCAVHERRCGQRADRAAGIRDDLLEGPVLVAVTAPHPERGDQEVGLTPHRALGHARRAAGVAEVQIVAGPGPDDLVGQHRVGNGERRLVVDGARQQRLARAVVDLQDELRRRAQGGQHLGERRCEDGVHDHGPCAGVLEQVAQLLGDVAVVHVERCATRLPRAQHRLEVLGTVVQVERHVVLTRRPGVVDGTALAQSGVEQHPCQAPGAVAHLVPGEGPVTVDQAGSVRVGERDRLGDRGDVEFHGHQSRGAVTAGPRDPPPSGPSRDPGRARRRRAARGPSRRAPRARWPRSTASTASTGCRARSRSAG